jgi:hypothetical protein
MNVYDSWWPWRLGRVIKRSKGSTWVKWSDGKVDRYDRANLRFLRTATGDYYQWLSFR